MTQPDIIVSSDVALASLNERETAFVLYVIQNPTRTQTDAAQACGYSVRETARKMGTRMMKRPKVKDALRSLRRELSERAKIDAIWVLRRLADMAAIDIKDMFTDDGTLKAISDMPEACRKAITSIETTEIHAGQGEKRILVGHAKKVKIVDPIRVLELIGKHIDVNAFRPDINLQAPTLILRDYTGKEALTNGGKEKEIGIADSGKADRRVLETTFEKGEVDEDSTGDEGQSGGNSWDPTGSGYDMDGDGGPIGEQGAESRGDEGPELVRGDPTNTSEDQDPTKG